MMSNNYTDFTELYNDIKMMEQHINNFILDMGTVLFILTFFSLCLYLNFYNNKKNEEVNQIYSNGNRILIPVLIA